MRQRPPCPSPKPMIDLSVPVLLYDGTCALCNGIVRGILRIDTGAKIHFAPLQSPTAQEFLRSAGLPTDSFDSLVFVPDWARRSDGKWLLRTDGVLAVFTELGGAWRAVGWLRVLPRSLRDALYRLVAKTRYAVFGSYRPRPLSNPMWRERFLEL